MKTRSLQPLRTLRRNMKALSAGFTLLELVLYMGIFSILILLFSQIFNAVLFIQQESQATSSVSGDSQFILTRFSYDIRRAESVSAPLNLGDEGSSLQLLIDGVNYTYSLNGENLNISNNNGTNVLNGFNTKVSSLNFKKIGNAGGKETISIGFTLTSKTERKGGVEAKDFQTTIGRR